MGEVMGFVSALNVHVLVRVFDFRKEDRNMKDNNTSTSDNMINRNWSTKRKRRKLPCGPELSNLKEKNAASPASVSPKMSSSVKKKTKIGATSTRSSDKKKGIDGSYYECVICDLGGKLLCCDNCPRTYHLQCLDPPLKRIPTNKWHCPKCCQKSGDLLPIGRLDSISKRARTKTIKIKSQTGIKPPGGADRVSEILGSSILIRNRSPSGGKSISEHEVKPSAENPDSSPEDGTCKPSNQVSGESVDVETSPLNVNDEKKPHLSPTGSLKEDKLLAEEDLSRSKLQNSELNVEAQEEKHELSCENESPGGEPVLVTDAADEKCKKRKDTANTEGPSKKRRTVKGKRAGKTSKKHRSKLKNVSSLVIKLPQKRKATNKLGISASLSEEDVELKKTDSPSKKNPQEQEQSSEELIKAGTQVHESVTCEDNVIGELRQVDRVLGCRVFGDNTSPVAYGTHLEDLQIPENENIILEENSPDDTDLGNDLTENVSKDCLNGVEDSCTEEALKDDNTVDKLHVYKRCNGGNMDSTTQDNKNLDSAAVNYNEQDDESPLSADDQQKGEENELKDTEENKETDVSSSAENKGVNVSYEFLVKWVGKSHIHNSWISEHQLKALAKRKLENYKAKYGMAVINICEECWKKPQRVIALRVSKNGTHEAFVKWTGLSYYDCTWERLDEPVLEKYSYLIDAFEQFERQALERNETLGGSSKPKEGDICTITEQPEKLKGGALFPHQLEALNWLRKCWHKSKNVILADEMGLGKTISACAFISSLYYELKVTRPCMVLVPLSTMPNWLAEFSLWAPYLNIVEYHGSAKSRAMIRQYEWHATQNNKKTASYKFNVLLTTYEMILADSCHLRGVPWELLIVDEGHRLKNSGSKLFGLLNTYSFQHRVLLTGTPLQNNIGEMYNLLNFLQPSSFPSLSSFEEKFNDLTTAEKVEELKKLVAPHMLRRLKKDAMQNIPPKTERMVPVELSAVQAELYRAVLTKDYQLLRNIGKGVAAQSLINVVMQLRKVCNHPYLIHGTEPESDSVEFLHEMRIQASAKLTLLHSMLKILHKDGHRVLIFSQMTKLLDILEDYLLVEFGTGTYERVDGTVAVADRQSAIARFNQDKRRFVFLLSTRACGLGINLATADTVIIYDSDFNPHADIQAMNRAHRIGQSKRLLVYRLVVRASVEERILQLAKRKLMLDQIFVNKSPSPKEMEDILRWGTEELFRDSSNNGCENNKGKDETVVEIEIKQRKKGGGLGDVYQDKCTDNGGSKIVWDDNAILKLLDRSILQAGPSDISEGDLENDMLGSVKSLEWNDDVAEEQATESPPNVTDDASVPERKEDNVETPIEENEWDRLLRSRWEKYQTEQEAVLGRGKRQRKAVSYREAYAPHPTETISEDGVEDEKAPEPEREYTPAGRALKDK
ncbi:hypothetical protein ACFE04_029780 [Oxalis oulophora]